MTLSAVNTIGIAAWVYVKKTYHIHHIVPVSLKSWSRMVSVAITQPRPAAQGYCEDLRNSRDGFAGSVGMYFCIQDSNSYS